MFISTDQIKRELDVILKGKWSTSHFAGFSDHQYYAPPRQEIELYLKYNPLLLNPNSPVAGTEGFDCDDFSFALKGQIALFNRNRAHQPHSWAVGLIWGHLPGLKICTPLIGL
ncbi:MAG: hypothetical protein KDD36_05040 [Flavobacteriales bacterium]|nr:hypothetical protein [Flavobacteriales bacterium]